jgi:hypothetical protein
MLPSIGLFISVEMISDGGSLVASFQGSDGCRYWLILPVRLNKLSSGEYERVGYEAPAVLDRLGQRAIPVTWQHARVLLAQMHPLLREERHRKWYGIMEEALQVEGALPSGVNRHFDKPNAGKQNEPA